MKKKEKILIVALVALILAGATAFVIINRNAHSDAEASRYTDTELSDMALDYFTSNTESTLPKEEYSVGTSEEVIDQYADMDMITIEIRHINGTINTLDARYYINVNTAKGFDDMENEIDLGAK